MSRNREFRDVRLSHQTKTPLTNSNISLSPAPLTPARNVRDSRQTNKTNKSSSSKWLCVGCFNKSLSKSKRER